MVGAFDVGVRVGVPVTSVRPGRCRDARWALGGRSVGEGRPGGVPARLCRSKRAGSTQPSRVVPSASSMPKVRGTRSTPSPSEPYSAGGWRCGQDHPARPLGWVGRKLAAARRCRPAAPRPAVVSRSQRPPAVVPVPLSPSAVAAVPAGARRCLRLAVAWGRGRRVLPCSRAVAAMQLQRDVPWLPLPADARRPVCLRPPAFGSSPPRASGRPAVCPPCPPVRPRLSTRGAPAARCAHTPSSMSSAPASPAASSAPPASPLAAASAPASASASAPASASRWRVRTLLRCS